MKFNIKSDYVNKEQCLEMRIQFEKAKELINNALSIRRYSLLELEAMALMAI
ncbi:MAG: hypothetical protein ACUVTD_04785 [Nitrososphaerales archaeon]